MSTDSPPPPEEPRSRFHRKPPNPDTYAARRAAEMRAAMNGRFMDLSDGPVPKTVAQLRSGLRPRSIDACRHCGGELLWVHEFLLCPGCDSGGLPPLPERPS